MTEEREDEALEERLRKMLLARRDGPPSAEATRALARMVERTLRVYQEVLAVAIAGLPFPVDEEIADMEAGRAPVSKAAFQIAEIWRASLALEDAEGHLAEVRRPPMARKDMPVLLRAARLELKTRRSPERGASPEMQRFVTRLLKKKA